MNKAEAEILISHLDEDERMDLLMYLAEETNMRVYSSDKDVTYFISTDNDG